MMIELVREMQVIQGTRELRYIGMGAKYFTDFLLLHNEFGITDMISIEAETERRVRYEFNKPLKSIDMEYGKTGAVLPTIENFDKKMNLVWLDYDSCFSKEMLEDVETLGKRMCVGSMFFVSCNYSFEGNNQSDKQESFQKKLGDYFDPNIEGKYTNKGIPVIIQKLVTQYMKKHLDIRNRCKEDSTKEDGDIKYMQLLFLTYKDGAPMMTVGGILVDSRLERSIIESGIFKRLSYCVADDKPFSINIPKLTYKEIQLILREMPATKEEYEQHKNDFYGIEWDEIEQFEKIYRYYPFYTEGNINA